jgi:membrane-associated phospholipid phosphatase
MGFRGIIKRIDEWDQKTIKQYNAIGGKSLTYTLKTFSFLGRETLWIFLIAFYLFVWYDPFLLSNIGAIFLIGLFIIVIIKKSVNRIRPFDKLKSELKLLEKKPSSKSFPSWHSYNITSYSLLFGIFFMRSPLITIIMLFLTIIVSFSRIQLGVHYPSDVIFGSVIGILGFMISTLYIAPILEMILDYFENFALHTIEYRQFNSFLFENTCYVVFWILICIIILLSATFKQIRDKIKKREVIN